MNNSTGVYVDADYLKWFDSQTKLRTSARCAFCYHELERIRIERQYESYSPFFVKTDIYLCRKEMLTFTTRRSVRVDPNVISREREYLVETE